MQDVHLMMKQNNPDALRGFSHDHRGHRQAEHLKARFGLWAVGQRLGGLVGELDFRNAMENRDFCRDIMTIRVANRFLFVPVLQAMI